MSRIKRILRFFSVFALTLNCSNNKAQKQNTINFLELEEKKSTENFLPVLNSSFIEKIEQKYAGEEYKQYPNVYSDLIEKLCNDVYDKMDKNENHSEFLRQLTKEQRVLFTLVNFEAQVNNGGVYQFLFNYPELSIIALESMEEAKMAKLAADYRKVLEEFFGKFKTMQELNNKFQDQSSNWEKRWNSFVDGYKELKSTEIIESYFYNEDFVKQFQNDMINYIKANKLKLYKIK